MIEAAMENNLFQAAAVYASQFKQDVIAVLRERSMVNHALRIAALNYVAKLKKEAAEDAKGSRSANRRFD